MTKLEEIVAYKQEELRQLKKVKPLSKMEQALKHRPPIREFQRGIFRPGHLSLIAEVKRSSPSAGAIQEGADAVKIARVYEEAGAQAISVLTDRKFFSGNLNDLTQAKEKVRLPVLRKDFLLEEYQVIESAAAGADCVLLIVSILEPEVLRRLMELASDLSMDALVEVHTERELKVALDAGAPLIGMNHRDLLTFDLDLKTSQRLIGRIPPDRTVVSESGIHSHSDVEFLKGLGVHAVLIGEELMASSDIKKRIKELMGW